MVTCQYRTRLSHRHLRCHTWQTAVEAGCWTWCDDSVGNYPIFRRPSPETSQNHFESIMVRVNISLKVPRWLCTHPCISLRDRNSARCAANGSYLRSRCSILNLTLVSRTLSFSRCGFRYCPRDSWLCSYSYTKTTSTKTNESGCIV